MTISKSEDSPDRESAEVLEGWWNAAKSGELSWSELAERLWRLETPTRDGATIDLDRQRRCGFSEAIFGEGKEIETLRSATQRLLAAEQEVLITRISPESAAILTQAFPSNRYHAEAKTLRIGNRIPKSPEEIVHPHSTIAVVTAGSTDSPVASEALETLAWMGIATLRFTDIGVAGPYRLLSRLPELRQCAAAIVIAGMEGALPSVLGGLLPIPIIAIPTSVGYGANMQGIVTLLAMLSSCAANVSVVNIDAGFKGAYFAGLVARQIESAGRHEPN